MIAVERVRGGDSLAGRLSGVAGDKYCNTNGKEDNVVDDLESLVVCHCVCRYEKLAGAKNFGVICGSLIESSGFDDFLCKFLRWINFLCITKL